MTSVADFTLHDVFAFTENQTVSTYRSTKAECGPTHVGGGCGMPGFIGNFNDGNVGHINFKHGDNEG